MIATGQEAGSQATARVREQKVKSASMWRGPHALSQAAGREEGLEAKTRSLEEVALPAPSRHGLLRRAKTPYRKEEAEEAQATARSSYQVALQ